MGTETFDPRYKGLETWGEERILAALVEGQAGAVDSVRRALPQIGRAALAIAERLRHGGRLVYVGAGTSGRLAVQDGIELTPTYGWPPERLVYILAGDDAALTGSVEGAEDDEEKARAAAEGVMPGDAVVAVAASGRTPFTVATLGEARRRGAVAVAIANNPATPLLAVADHPILLDTGPEAIAGSTRLKAGTAQKVALGLLSTLTMIRLGRTHDGLMVDLIPTNDKLRARAVRIVRHIAGVEESAARMALKAAGGHVKLAVVIARGLEAGPGSALLERHGGDLRRVLADVDTGSPAG